MEKNENVLISHVLSSPEVELAYIDAWLAFQRPSLVCPVQPCTT